MSGLRPVGITGVGSFAPPGIMTNADLEKLVDTTDEWIVSRTGIRERHRATEQECNSDIALVAAQKALAEAGVQPEEIELLIMATVTPDMFMPSTACILQDRLGAKNAAAFDLTAGCSGFAYGVTLASKLIGSGAYNKILVIGCDVLTKVTDWTDRNTCVLFGDGGGAAVLEPVEEGLGIIDSFIGADGSGWDLIEVPAGGTRTPASHETVDKGMHFIKMKGQEVFKWAVPNVVSTVNKLLEHTGISKEDIALIVPHQANDRILESAAKRLKIPKEKFYTNLERFGNTSGGSIPLALDEALTRGCIKKGDTIFFVGFGAGLTWAGVAMKWAYEPRRTPDAAE